MVKNRISHDTFFTTEAAHYLITEYAIAAVLFSRSNVQETPSLKLNNDFQCVQVYDYLKIETSEQTTVFHEPEGLFSGYELRTKDVLPFSPLVANGAYYLLSEGTDFTLRQIGARLTTLLYIYIYI